MSNIEEVGARLVLQNKAAFQAGLKAATDAVDAFADAQERAAKIAGDTADTVSDAAKTQADTVKGSAATATAAVKTQATETAAARDTIVGANADIAKSSVTARDTVVGSMVATTGASKKGAKALSDLSSKVLMYGGAVGLFAGYEGVKKYLSFQQQVAQLGINAGITAKQLPALSAGFLKVSDATGMAATSVANMGYYLASANPHLKTTTKQLLAMTMAAGQLNVLAGNSANPTAISRAYGAIVSNALPLVAGGKALAYSTAGGTAINEFLNATTGHGDMTIGALTSALGTGVLPLAKTYGLSLNEFGAALDVLSPAMNANSAATRLKTAIGMLGSPTSKAAETFELFGGNVTTAASMLRSKGLGGLLGYMSNLFSGRVTGKTFATAFYGGGLGKITGGAKGVGSGAGEYLRVLGFTPSQAAVMEGPGGVSAFGKMTQAQLVAQGFAKGTTGAQAVQVVVSALTGGAYGGGHTGAAMMQLLNERGVYGTKLAQIAGSENPATYNAALKLAFAEPKVQLAMFGQAISNLTIAIGQDLTPDVVILSKALLSVGSWFGKNKWAVEALGIGAATIYGAAGVVKTVEVTSKIFSGIKSIAGLTGTTGLTGVLGLNTAAVNANTLALGGKLPKSLPGVAGVPGDAEPAGFGAIPLVAATTTVASIGAATAAMYGIYRGANWLSQWATGFGKFASGYEGSGWSKTAPKLGQSAAARFNTAAQLAAKGQSMPLWLRNELGPSDIAAIANYEKMPLGAVLPGAYGTRSKFTKTWAPASGLAMSDWSHYVAGLSPAAAKSAQANLSARSPAQQAGLMNIMGTMGVGLGPAGSFLSAVGAASKLKNPAAQGTAAFHASAQLVLAAVQQKDAADHQHMTASQLSETAKQYSATLEKLITSSTDEANAATTTQTSANQLNAAARTLAAAALKLDNAAANAATSLSPDGLYGKVKVAMRNSAAGH